MPFGYVNMAIDSQLFCFLTIAGQLLNPSQYRANGSVLDFGLCVLLYYCPGFPGDYTPLPGDFTLLLGDFISFTWVLPHFPDFAVLPIALFTLVGIFQANQAEKKLRNS